MQQNGKNGDSYRDDFWDIDKLIPKKKTTLNTFKTKPTVVEYQPTDGASETEADIPDGRINFEKHALSAKDGGEESYEPCDNGLIKKVTIKHSTDKYDFYGSFRKAALLYYDYKTDKCEYTPFFSYMPQYSQMNAEQRKYYFYWRSEIRRGKFLKTDYSYLYLYVYEILNLPDKIPAQEGLSSLCALWRAYRLTLPKIGVNFSVWIQDYCFIHRLPCPTVELRDFLYEAVGVSSFKEFYLSDFENSGEDGTASMVAFLSDYDWRGGKFIEQTDPQAYKKYMLTAMRSLILHLLHTGALFATDAKLQTVKRNAFPNSLCTHSVKCRLEIEYISLSTSAELRSAVTAAVRYTENKIRALAGVKSRLAVKGLPDGYKEIIDAYFALVTDKEERIRAREQMPEYEKLYDAPKESLSFEGADIIEQASWITTQRLVTEEEEENESVQLDIKPEVLDVAALTVSDTEEADTYGLGSEEISVLNMIKNGENLAEYDGLTLESLVERINEAFSDAIGDVIIYHDGEKFTIYDDYLEEIGEWLLKITK